MNGCRLAAPALLASLLIGVINAGGENDKWVGMRYVPKIGELACRI